MIPYGEDNFLAACQRARSGEDIDFLDEALELLCSRSAAHLIRSDFSGVGVWVDAWTEGEHLMQKHFPFDWTMDIARDAAQWWAVMDRAIEQVGPDWVVGVLLPRTFNKGQRA